MSYFQDLNKRTYTEIAATPGPTAITAPQAINGQIALTAAAAQAVTLPDGDDLFMELGRSPAGVQVTIKRMGGVGAVTVAPAAGDTLDGAGGAINLPFQYDSVTVELQTYVNAGASTWIIV